MDVVFPSGSIQHKVPLHDNGLQRLKRQYLQMLPIRTLNIPSGPHLKDVEVQRFLYAQLFAEQRSDTGYKLKVMKQIIESIESAFTDVWEDVRHRSQSTGPLSHSAYREQTRSSMELPRASQYLTFTDIACRKSSTSFTMNLPS